MTEATPKNRLKQMVPMNRISRTARRVPTTRTGLPVANARIDRDSWTWIVVAVAALVPRLAFVLLSNRLGLAGPVLTDSLQYQALARDLLAGRGWAPNAVNATDMLFRPPLYPWFLAGLYALFGPGATAVKVAQAMLGAVSAVFVSAMAMRLFGRRGGWIAGLLFALNPLLIMQANELMTEPLFIALYLAALYYFLRALDGSLWSACVSGGLLGLTVLCRPTPLIAVPVFAVALWRGRENWRAWLRGSAAFIICVGLVVLPWVVRGAIRTGAWVPVATTGEFTLYLGNAPGWAERVFLQGEVALGQDWDVGEYHRIGAEPPGWFANEARREILRDPVRFARLTLIRTGQFFKILPEFKGGPLRFLMALFGFTILFPIGLIGLIWALRRRDRFAWTVAAVLALVSLLHVVSIPSIRYRLALVDALLPVFAGGWLAWLWARLMRKSAELG
jgi:4-amino-4-deoxy-L-arabinose transferase-like glycosyltransferase